MGRDVDPPPTDRFPAVQQVIAGDRGAKRAAASHVVFDLDDPLEMEVFGAALAQAVEHATEVQAFAVGR